jgi:hypothetical protein
MFFNTMMQSLCNKARWSQKNIGVLPRNFLRIWMLLIFSTQWCNHFCKCDVKSILLMDYHEGLNDLNKVYVFSSNYHVPILWRWSWVKIKVVDDEGALNDLNAFQFKYVITLQRWSEVKKLLGDYQGASNNLKEAMFFNQWCNHFIKNKVESKYCWRTTKELWRTWLIVLNAMM